MRNQQGFTLLEVSVVLGVILTIGGVVAIGAKFMSDQAEAAAMRDHLIALRAAGEAAADQGAGGPLDADAAHRLAGLATEANQPAGRFAGAYSGPLSAQREADLVSGGDRAIVSPLGTLSTVVPPSAIDPSTGALFGRVSAYGLTRDQCVATVRVAAGAFERIRVGTASPIFDAIANPPITAVDTAELERQCEAQSPVDIDFLFAG